jgi:predicted nucleic acid-binding protein
LLYSFDKKENDMWAVEPKILSVVSNASPLIALNQINQLNLLRRLFHIILVPPVVVREVSPTVVLPDWITQRALMQTISSQILNTTLDPGESEAISLALEIGSIVILDERHGRRIAQSLGIGVIGTLGILLKSKQRGFIASVKPYIDQLMAYDFRISDDLYEHILFDAGEL